jgi:hypothetical protein
MFDEYDINNMMILISSALQYQYKEIGLNKVGIFNNIERLNNIIEYLEGRNG